MYQEENTNLLGGFVICRDCGAVFTPRSACVFLYSPLLEQSVSIPR